METFVNKLRQDYTQLTFRAGRVASWSPDTGQIFYSQQEDEESIWSTLHELGHALKGHGSYSSDVDLLKKETEAWEEAVSTGKKYGIVINDGHIQSCLDTYRDWLHRRSTCPTCGRHGLQRSKALYRCLNCQETWKVSSARFCRPYRLKMAEDAK